MWLWMNYFEKLSQNKNKWNDNKVLMPFLADRLAEGSLLIVLGAGVSRFYGMPDWEGLLRGIKNGATTHSVAKGRMSMAAWAEAIQLELFPYDKAGFNDAVGSTLYSDPDKFDLLKIADNKTLRSIGALCHASRRGRVNKVVTFNYDCLLEAYFAFHGIASQVIHAPSYIAQDADVTVFHPHGYIPHAKFSGKPSDGIVLARDDYEEAVETQWEQRILGLLSTHFVIFLGLSGEDDRLSAIARKAKENNPFITDEDKELDFYGMRICSKDDPMKSQWENRGIYCREVGAMNREIPKILFSICRAAAEQSIG